MLGKALAATIAACVILAAFAGVTVSIREWDAPTPNSHPHDPAVAPDGSLWYAAQLANKLGRLPESGRIKEFPWTSRIPDPMAWSPTRRETSGSPRIFRATSAS